MNIKKFPFLALLIIMTLSLAHLYAQDKKKKKEKEKEKEEEPVPVFNYTIDDPMDAFGPKDEKDQTRIFLLPEFYNYWPVENNDTIYRYDCYGAEHIPVIVDTLSDMNSVYSIVLIKTYHDFLHTYIDDEGKPHPKPMANMLYVYDRTGPNTWKSTDMGNNVSMELVEDKSIIVKTDTSVLTNTVTGNTQLTIRKYYKVNETHPTEVNGYSGSMDNSMINVAATIIFSVPEFYFPTAKNINDTTLEFLCYDVRDSLIPNVNDYDSVRYFSLFKKYNDPVNTYTDGNGEKKPLPVSSIIKRYDHIARDKWMSVEYPGNKYTQLKGFKDVIVKSDSMIVTDPLSGDNNMIIYNYYKVIKN